MWCFIKGTLILPHLRRLSLRTLEIKSDVRRLFVYREFFTGIINMTDSCHVELDMIGMEYEKR